MLRKEVGKHATIEMANKSLELMEKGTVIDEKKKVTEVPALPPLSFFGLLYVLKPYFWPTKGTDGALLNRIRSTSTWLMVICSKASSLSSPFFLAKATTSLIDKDWNVAFESIIFYLSLTFSSKFFSEMQRIFYVRVKQQAAIELSELTFRQIHDLSMNWHLSKKTGTVIKSMDRGIEAANNLTQYLFLFLIPALGECFLVILLFFSTFKLWSLGVSLFCGIVIYIVATIHITQWRKKFREATNKHDNDFHDKSTDSIINYETVKYFTAENHEVNRFLESVTKFMQYNSATTFSLSAINLTQQFILQITMFAAMYISGKAVIDDKMSIGDFVAVQAWLGIVFQPLFFLGTIYGTIVQALIDVRNLTELLGEEPDVVDIVGATTIPIDKESIALSKGISVEFKNVTFHYPSQPSEKGLKNISFLIEPGTTTAVVGHTGAGKTTISRLLFRFYETMQGSVFLDGHDIKKHTQKSVRELIGIVPQDTVLFNDTVFYNINYGKPDATKEEVYAAAESAQIREFIESLPDKWQTKVGERGLKLSGGEKQRVAIARCLLKNPPIVLLDEATSALDTITEHSVQLALNTLGKNRTVIIIAHRLSTIRNANQILVMHNGNVVEKGSHDKLLENSSSYYKQLWDMQLHAPTNIIAEVNVNLLEDIDVKVNSV